MASIPNTNITKQPLKYLEIPLNKFSDEVIPHHQKALEQHKVYVQKLIAVNDTKQLEKEIKDKKRSIKQLRDLLYELDTLRTQVEDDGLDAFDTKTMPLRNNILKLTRTYQELENRVDKMTPKNEPSPMSSPDDRINPFEGAQAIQIQEDLDSLKLQQEQARLNGVQEIQKKSEDLLEIHKDLRKLVKDQGEQVEEVETNITATQDNVQAGFLDVVKANKLKVATYPATGAFVGSLIGGPIGFLAGIKVGGLAALGCAVAGYMGVLKFFKLSKLMAGSALRRLMAEYRQLTLNPPEGIIAGPTNEENFFEWEALITGPEGTCFEGGVFPARLTFPPDYPLSPPKMQFTCDMFHPNIYSDGRVCISILHAPGDDPMGYESSAERWSPVQSVEKILLSVVSMLAEPNDESGANVDAAKMWRENRQEFNDIAEKLVRQTLGIPAGV